MGLLADVYTRLFTKEDTFNFHKTLGISCLISFIYRFSNVGEGDMKFTTGPATLLTILLHTGLSVSSMIFKIPQKRIVGGYRIWPEYRLHSIVFALRSLAGMLVTWYELRYGLPPNYYVNVAIVLGTIAAADLSTWSVGTAHSSTIRDLDAPPAVHFFFSAMQFQATMGCMLGLRRFSTQFLYVWVVQFNAFLMTIRRKNLAPHGVLVFTYGAMLAFGFCLAAYEQQRVGYYLLHNTLGNAAAVLRLHFRMHKYLLWALIGALTQLGRQSIDDAWPAAAYWPAAYGLSVAALLAVGWRKVRAKASAAKAEAAAGGKGGGPGDTPVVGSTPETAKLKAS